LLSQLEQNIAVSELPILVWGKYEEIAKRLINPFFGDMYITSATTSGIHQGRAS
jgi:hypothetical protein